MSINKLLTESNKWLKKADKSVVIKRPPEKPRAPYDDFVKQREGEIKARIGTLESQRDAAVERYNLAIEEQNRELERLRKEVAPPQPPKDKDTPARNGRRRKKDPS